MSQTTVNPPTRRAGPDASEWTPSLAECVARVYGIDPLSEAHWLVISECREEWARSGSVPGPERLAALSHMSVTLLHSLFPPGLLSLAWILAGVAPPPGVSTEPGESEPHEIRTTVVEDFVSPAAPKARGGS